MLISFCSVCSGNVTMHTHIQPDTYTVEMSVINSFRGISQSSRFHHSSRPQWPRSTIDVLFTRSLAYLRANIYYVYAARTTKCEHGAENSAWTFILTLVPRTFGCVMMLHEIWSNWNNKPNIHWMRIFIYRWASNNKQTVNTRARPPQP